MLLHTKPLIAVWTDTGRDDCAADVGVTNVDASYVIDVESASNSPLTYIALRWESGLQPDGIRVLGDHWERGYGDLEWRGVVAERVLPWYAITHDPRTGQSTGFGVAVGASAFASWRVDERGITLLLDVRCGGVGVQLSRRRLRVATVYELASTTGESPFEFVRRFCRLLCTSPRTTQQPIYGGNDWYFRYGGITAETVRRDSGLIRELSMSTTNAPTYVIDGGWATHSTGGGPYDRGTDKFPDMPGLASELKSNGVKPGIWIRPLLMTNGVPAFWRLPKEHPLSSEPGAYLDPSVPEVLDYVANDCKRIVDWGYGLIKHDFTTFDIFGKWGFEMGSSLTAPGWAFADRSRTSAEIILDLYRAIRKGAGDASLIGCNTVGHLGAGLFELQRTGDDTSGKVFERTRKMGVNTLAFRMPQHGAFFAADADCVGLTKAISWNQNAQWLDLLARSGTALFVSADPDYIGDEQKAALREAFVRSSVLTEAGEPLDWMDTACPRRWRFGNETIEYNWSTFPESAFACPP